MPHGYIVAEWGDTQRPDPTYSVAKSVLSTLVGITIERGMIPNVHDPVANLIHDGGCESAQSLVLTWGNKLQASSQWEGTVRGRHSEVSGKAAGKEGRG